jgi:hypothetical protein
MADDKMFLESVSSNPAKFHSTLLYLADNGFIQQTEHGFALDQKRTGTGQSVVIPDSVYSPELLLVASCFYHPFERWMLVDYIAAERGLHRDLSDDAALLTQVEADIDQVVEKATAFGILEGKRRLKFVTETARGLLFSQLSDPEVIQVRRKIVAVLFRRIFASDRLPVSPANEDIEDSKPRDIANQDFVFDPRHNAALLEATLQQLASLDSDLSYVEMKALAKNADRAAAFAEETGRLEIAHEILYTAVDSCRLLYKYSDMNDATKSAVQTFWARSLTLALSLCVRLATTQMKLHMESKARNTMRRLDRKCKFQPVDPFNLPLEPTNSIAKPTIDLEMAGLMLSVHDLRVRLCCSQPDSDLAKEILSWLGTLKQKVPRETLIQTATKWKSIYQSLEPRMNVDRPASLRDNPRFYAVHALSMTLVRGMLALGTCLRCSIARVLGGRYLTRCVQHSLTGTSSISRTLSGPGLIWL